MVIEQDHHDTCIADHGHASSHGHEVFLLFDGPPLFFPSENIRRKLFQLSLADISRLAYTNVELLEMENNNLFKIVHVCICDMCKWMYKQLQYMYVIIRNYNIHIFNYIYTHTHIYIYRHM